MYFANSQAVDALYANSLCSGLNGAGNAEVLYPLRDMGREGAIQQHISLQISEDVQSLR